MNRNFYRILCLIIAIAFQACSKELPEISVDVQEDNAMPLTKAIVPEEFDWETADWMPTPPGQALIPVPWGNQGSISGFYGLDVVHDYLKIDGWKLIYSTFRDYGEELIDPYFVLYNVYRGTLRIYFFLTNPYIGPSTYLQDAIAINSLSGYSTTLLRYLNNEIIDAGETISIYSQIQPKMPSGGAPLAARRWYMLEYEMAYDPNIQNYTSDQINLTWFLNYLNVSAIQLNGTANSEIYGTVGGTNNFLSDINGKLGKGALSIIGLGTLDKLTVNKESGENKLKLNKAVFKSIVSGIEKAVSSFSSGVPGIAIDFLNSVFGGNSSSGQSTVSLKSNATIELSGTSTEHGAVSSTPIDIKIPGTQISASASGYIPLYNQPMGVFHWKGNVSVTVNEVINITKEEDDIMFTGKYDVKRYSATVAYQDYSKYVTFNPAVTEVANVSVISQQLYGIDTDGDFHKFPLSGVIYDSPWESDSPIPEIENACIKLLIMVEPKNGAPSSYITKTFYVDNFKWNTTRNFYY